ncbi:MAG TPA: hypothetical protein VHE55_17770 [Fimbriimonadaceae bacterium]|nr:hypothetical protein [Fimbriimonadaceae bacterium]
MDQAYLLWRLVWNDLFVLRLARICAAFVANTPNGREPAVENRMSTFLPLALLGFQDASARQAVM